MKKRIMFVCMGNICRSPLAHAVFDAKVKQQRLGAQFSTESSGTISYHQGELPDARMRATASRHGIDMNHRARHFTAQDIADYDLILAMDQDNLQNILEIAPRDADVSKIKLFREYDPAASPGAEVPDPYYGGDEGFEHVYEIVDRTCDNLIKTLVEKQ